MVSVTKSIQFLQQNPHCRPSFSMPVGYRHHRLQESPILSRSSHDGAGTPHAARTCASRSGPYHRSWSRVPCSVVPISARTRCPPSRPGTLSFVRSAPPPPDHGQCETWRLGADRDGAGHRSKVGRRDTSDLSDSPATQPSFVDRLRRFGTDRVFHPIWTAVPLHTGHPRSYWMLADTGYRSEANIGHCERVDMEPLMPKDREPQTAA